jgi:NAD(P)-dependent dehydrogenase (short-subunit alcohol dehydrogenase family)
MTVALVTGTSSGIGLATAVALARAGHTVAATMRNPNAAGDIERIVAVEKLPVVISELNVNDDASVVNSLPASSHDTAPSIS